MDILTGLSSCSSSLSPDLTVFTRDLSRTIQQKCDKYLRPPPPLRPE